MLQTIDLALEDLSAKAGLPMDVLKIMIVFLINMPLSALFMFLKKPLFRMVYSLVVGLVELIFLLEFEAVYVLAAVILNFVFIKLVKRDPFIVSIVCSVVTLIIVHLHRFIFDYSSWKVDCSVYVMYMVTKLTYFGFALQHKKVDANVSVLSYFSYCLFFPGLLVGPTFSFERFLDYINFNNEYRNNKFSLRNTLQALGKGLVVAVITAVTMPIFDYEWVLKDPGYQGYSLFGKLIAINIIGFFYRVKFYTAWYLVQVSVNLSGVSYSQNGKNDSVAGGSIMFQVQPNPKNKTQYWNASIQIWLKVVVYDSIAKLTTNQTVTVFGTFLVSAFWHGIYLTYYFGFIQWGIVVQLTKFFYKLSFFLPQKFRQSQIVTVLVYLAGTITLNYIGMGIVLLKWQNMVAFYEQLHYSITIGMLVFFILSFVVKTPRQPKKSQQQYQITTPQQAKRD